MQTNAIATDLAKASGNTPADSVSAARDDRKWKVAKDFEAMFLHQMFKSMRNTLSGESIAGEESNGRRIFSEMLDEEMAKRASEQGGIGLADLIYRHMDGTETTPTKEVPLSVLGRSDYAGAAAGYTSASRTRKRATDDQVADWVDEASSAFDVDPDLVRAVIHQESGGNSLAESSQGAKGLMQLMDGTASDMGVNNSWDGRQNVLGGTRYLKKLLNTYDGNETLALAAYNAGPENVRKHGGVPPFTETQNYVKSVLGHRRRLQQDKEVAYGG